MTGKRTHGGGGQCGRIRYTATYHPDGANLCHCRMCEPHWHFGVECTQEAWNDGSGCIPE